MFYYYEQPSDEIFNQIKENSIEIRKTYDNDFGYVDEKLNRIEGIVNYKDNIRFIVGMFDLNNQYKLRQSLEGDARELLNEFLKYKLNEDF